SRRCRPTRDGCSAMSAKGGPGALPTGHLLGRSRNTYDPHVALLRRCDSHVSAEEAMKFRVYRYDPDRDASPRMQDYDVTLDPHDRMLLDAMIRLKAQDDTLSFRRSCREGVCGSDAMNINGKNGLACITNLKALKEPVELRPLPGLPVIR